MSGKLTLLGDDSDSESESESEFKVNKSYAAAYDKWRQKEEFKKLKDRGEVDSDSSSSDSEVPEIEEEFLNTLSLLKSKDPKIYDKNVTFFSEGGKKKVAVKKEKKPKPIFMKDHKRKLLLEKGEESDDEEHMPYEGPSYNEEQKELIDSFKSALKDSSDDEDDDGYGLLQIRQKSKAEKESEEADYILWLKGQKAEVSENTEKELLFLQKFWNDPKIDEGEKFLKDYILNKGYMEENKSDEIPTYAEITEDISTLSDDENLIKKQEMFEQKYNFRFEEPDEEFIKRYPRTIGDSLRRTETKRKLKREDYAERKKKEKEQRREDLKRLKAIKRKEIEEKFEKLNEISGFENLEMNEIDIESDFDPEKHDEKMNNLFNEDYYGVEEMQKPEFEYDEELDDERWDQWTGPKDSTKKDSSSKGENESSESESEEAKVNPKLQFQKEMIQASFGGKKRKQKKSLFAKLLAQPKPVFDPQGKSFEEYLEDYYKLDYEDVVGDMPVRFKYRKVMANNFGLTVDEILKADDKELNRWCSVKKTSQYRNDEEEKYDVQAFKKKAENVNAKKKILQSLFAEPEEGAESSQTEEHVQSEGNLKRKGVSSDIGKKRKRSKKIKHEVEESKIESKTESDLHSETNANLGNDEDVSELSDTRQKKKKFKKMKEFEEKSENQSIKIESDSDKPKQEKFNHDLMLPTNSSNADSPKKRKKKKKKKQKSTDISTTQTFPQYKNTNQAEININDNIIGSNKTLEDETDSSKSKPEKSNGDLMLPSNSSNTDSAKKRKKKKKKKQKSTDMPTTQTFPQHKNKNKQYKQSAESGNKFDISDARLKAYGINPKKFNRRKVY